MGEQVWGKLGEVGAAFGKSNLMISMGYIPMQSEPPTVDHVAQEDGTWAIPLEKLEDKFAIEIATTDQLRCHAEGHEFDGDDERADRAWAQYAVARAEIKEKYGKGSKVLVTETGTCYHNKIDCSVLSGHETKEINLSDGLKNYSPCSMCCS